MSLPLSPLDWLPLAAYGVFLVVIGFWPQRETTDDFLIAGRRVGLLTFVATLVATWYGAVLGAGEFVYTDGLAAWTANDLPYYVFALLFALLLARRVRGQAAGLYTIPDKLAQAYDRRTALLGAAFAFVYASPGQYVLMTGLLLQALFGWPLIVAMAVGVLFSVVYVFRGGFLTDIRVNTLQFVLMYLGFAVAAFVCLRRFGGLAALTARGALPAGHLTLLGTHSTGWAIVWFFIAITTLADPGFHQRCYAARTPRTAVLGILLAVCCWFTFDLLTIVTGLFSRALIPNLANPTMAYPALAARVMSPGLKGIFVVGMLAPIMASTVSWTFLSAMTIGRDFVWRLRGGPETAVPGYTRVGLAITSVTAIGIALAMPSVVQQWYALGNVFVPAILLPLLGAYSPAPRWRAPAAFAFWAMLTGGALAAISLGWGWRHGGVDDPHFLLGWQPMYLGLLGCALVYLAGIVSKNGA